ncbi:hypothetical protein K2X14_04820 [Acetobacter sp. TBRC 12305]|uniref:Stress-induced protein n=1 Tax=Acetobacter garciniae TaxID=2817435 RepID=A0A939KPW3_9PROT|nr:KGG domain-containing protein [Acetobacter garciniae]MBO1324477.1 hypothetical protein [Acetobacter garciniae]MBX0344166.1 hypothetical protein [Acetobacter garciniae]
MSYQIHGVHARTLPPMAPADSRGGGGAAHNPGNFANDPKKASEAGQKGGQHSHGKDSEGMKQGAGTHSTSKSTGESKHASDSTHKGGQHSSGKT